MNGTSNRFRAENYREYMPKRYYQESNDDSILERELNELTDGIKSLNHYKELPKYSAAFLGPLRQKDLVQSMLLCKWLVKV